VCLLGSLAAQQPSPPKHPVRIAETLAFRKPSEVQISPNGTQVAYVVTEPVLRANRDHAALYVADATGTSAARKISEGVHITTLRWSAGGRWIVFVLETESSRDIWRASPSNDTVEQLTSLKDELAYSPTYRGGAIPYQLSPDGKTLVYAAYDSVEAERKFKSKVEGGVLYRGEWSDQLMDLKWQPALYVLWSYDIRAKRTTKLWETQLVVPPGYFPPEIQISPNGHELAILHQTSDDKQYSLDLLDLARGAVHPFLPNLYLASDLRWSNDGKSLSFDSFGEYQSNEPHAEEITHYTASLADRSMKPDKSATLASIFNVNDVARAVEQRYGDMLHDCSLDRVQARATCVKEGPMAPPEVVSVPLKDREPISRPLVLTHLNPDYDTIQLGQVSTLAWPGAKGQPGPQAGLILPVGFVSGRRYPLVVMLYNTFSGREFIYQAGLFTSLPAQAFAGHGYAVLLMNLPEGHGVYKSGDFEAAKEAEIGVVVSALRSAVDSLVARGIVDPHRMGIMGWSFGSFCTDYLITHYPDWFQAAASGEGGLNNPSGYWLTNDAVRATMRGLFGGGPYGKYLARWQEISPALNMQHLRVPLLMEYSTAYLSGLEIHQAIVEQGGQAELVLYPGEDHVFLRPLNRYNSMMRHFDWFNFWLLGQEDLDPAKAEQYKRWRELRKQQEANAAATRPN
jgi:dipeptidyl aminopeptidase/acylaminoacyl peptidase